jgi:hypothetical protein
MEDRISALDGSIEFVSAPGHGAVVSGAVPLTTRPASSLTGDEFEPVA